ncbi:GWxTD domain-containing protein [candidate division KSB1 bacterium]|nr:GWxTD domain-containing protein [candidate division KSB1 bacterium]
MPKIFTFISRPLGVIILWQIILSFIVCHAQPRLKPNLDAAQFQDKAGQAYLEIYYSLPEAAITYVSGANEAAACRLLLALQIYHDRKLWASKSWKIEKSFAGASGLKNTQHLVDALSYLVDTPGRYCISLQVRDLHRPDRADSASAEIEVRRFSPEKLELSDLELASAIRPSAASSPAVFTKHAQEVIPNAMTLFGEGAPELYYYFEAYHLLQNVPGRKYKTLCRIHDAEGEIVENLGSTFRTKIKRFDASVEIGMMNIAGLPSGKYRLTYGIADSAETALASREKMFFIYNPSVQKAQNVNGAALPKIASGPLLDLDEKALDEEFSRMFFLTTPNDKKFYKSLANVQAKREYIASLWQSTRPDEAQTGLAYRQLYLLRAEDAGKRFKSPSRPGWKTDRGRVFILYGAPSHIDRTPSSTTSLPYETWTYDNLKGQGGVVFVFADRMGFSNYEQIHSTLQGELQDPNWQQLITRSCSGKNRIIEVQ